MADDESKVKVEVESEEEVARKASLECIEAISGHVLRELIACAEENDADDDEISQAAAIVLGTIIAMAGITVSQVVPVVREAYRAQVEHENDTHSCPDCSAPEDDKAN